MAEYFDISLIIEKDASSKTEVARCLEELNLSEGENETNFFEGKRLIVSYFEEAGADFYKLVLGLPNHIFHANSFEDELEPFAALINKFFRCINYVRYALCSYELNGYLIGDTKSIEYFDTLLDKFPIVYVRSQESNIPTRMINLKAQEIFS